MALNTPIIPKIAMILAQTPDILKEVIINAKDTIIAMKNRVFFSFLTPFFCNFFLKISGLTRNKTPKIIKNHPTIAVSISTSFLFIIA